MEYDKTIKNNKREMNTFANQSKYNEHWIIIHKGMPFMNKIFNSDKQARNWIKMEYSTRRFKEPEENIFVCKQYGTTFKIIQLLPEPPKL